MSIMNNLFTTRAVQLIFQLELQCFIRCLLELFKKEKVINSPAHHYAVFKWIQFERNIYETVSLLGYQYSTVIGLWLLWPALCTVSINGKKEKAKL